MLAITRPFWPGVTKPVVNFSPLREKSVKVKADMERALSSHNISNLGLFSHSLALIRPSCRNFNPFKHLWQPLSCSTIGETGEMKDFQQISQHGTWLKIPQMARKTLTQTKTFSSIKPDEHVFLRLPGTSDVRPRALKKHKLFISNALQWLSTYGQWILEKPLSLSVYFTHCASSLASQWYSWKGGSFKVLWARRRAAWAGSCSVSLIISDLNSFVLSFFPIWPRQNSNWDS